MKKLLVLIISIFLSGNMLAALDNDLSKYIVRTFIDKEGKSVDEIIVPGRPPIDHREPAVELPDIDRSKSVNVLSNVPVFDWCFGCSATSAAMIAGYYDRTGYDNMYTGPTNGGVMPMDNSSWPDVVINGENRHQCPLSATHQGLDGRITFGHVDDYWHSYGSTIDPYYGNWAEHGYADCTADYMGTNQYHNWQNTDASTTFYFYTNGSPCYDYTACEPNNRDGCHGFKEFIESRGYSVQTNGNYSQYIYGHHGNTLGFTFNQFKAEIEAGRPVMIQVAGHTMVGLGYDDSSNLIYIHDTWDHSNHTMAWGGTYGGMQHYGVGVFILDPAPAQLTAVFSADITQGEAPLEVTFIDSSYAISTTITSWYWNFGDGVDTTYTAFQTTVEHTYQLAGTYDVSLIISDGTISDTLLIENYITAYGLFAYYPFTNGSVEDSSGNEHDLTLFEAIPATDRFQSTNSAYWFDGSNDYMISTDLNLSYGNESINIWAKGDTSRNGLIEYIISDTKDEDTGIRFSTDGILSVRVKGSSICTTSSSYRDNQWHMYSVIMDSENFDLHVDGDYIATNSIGSDPIDGEISLGVEGDEGGINTPEYFLKGFIDDIRIYNRILTQSEIDSLYHIDGWPILQADFNSDGYVDAADLQLLGDHWHFDENNPGWDSRYNLCTTPDPGSGLQIIDAGDLQVFGDFWHEGTPPKLIE